MQDKYMSYSKYQSDLRMVAEGWFVEKGLDRDPTYPFVLNREIPWQYNLIDNDIYENVKHIEPMHPWTRNGLSSQSMCFNLLGPLVGNPKTNNSNLAPLKRACENSAIPWPSNAKGQLEFNAMPLFQEASKRQSTSLDVAINSTPDSDDKSLFIEVKLSENRFGGCNYYKKDTCSKSNLTIEEDLDCHYSVKVRTCWTLMRRHSLLDCDLGESNECPFRRYFQFFRELLVALEYRGIYVLLYDEHNPTFIAPEGSKRTGVFTFLRSRLPDEIQPFVKSFTVQEVLREIATDSSFSHANDFAVKYGMVDALKNQ